jgi:hypothetical protein
VAQGEPVAGRFRTGSQAVHLAHVPVQPFMAVEEAEIEETRPVGLPTTREGAAKRRVRGSASLNQAGRP